MGCKVDKDQKGSRIHAGLGVMCFLGSTVP